MRAKFSGEQSERILRAAMEIWKAEHPEVVVKRVELGRRLWTVFHCKTRTVQVRSYKESSRPGWLSKLVDVEVCPVCFAGQVMTRDV